MLRAESNAQSLRRSAPDLAPVVSAVLAESYARQYRSFGGALSLRKKAEDALRAVPEGGETLESLAARVLIADSSKARLEAKAALEAEAPRYLRSPKLWMLRGILAEAEGDDRQALDALYRALALNRNHRGTLLLLARWHARHGGVATAFQYYDDILSQDVYGEDIEVVLDRYVLGQITSEDESASRTVATLAGLVREELVNVAKAETARAAIAFALSLFAKDDDVAGLNELGRAQGAFEESAAFQAVLGGMFLAAGDWSAAEQLFERAEVIEPDRIQHQLNLARARYGMRAMLEPASSSGGGASPPDAAATNTSMRSSSRSSFRSSFRSTAKSEVPPLKSSPIRMPFGASRFVHGEFALVETEPSPGVFPESAFGQIGALKLNREAAKDALETASLLALAEHFLSIGRLDQSQSFLREAEAEAEAQADAKARARVKGIRGRIHLRRGERKQALEALKDAHSSDRNDVSLRFTLADAYLLNGRPIEAIDILDGLDREGVVSPARQVELARLKIKRGDREGALKLLRSLVSFLPKDLGVRLALGEAMLTSGLPDTEIVSVYAGVLSVEPKLSPKRLPTGVAALSVADLLYLGRAALERGARRRGVSLLRAASSAASARQKADLAVDFYLGKALVEHRGSRREGLRLLDRFLRSRPSSRVLEAEARALRRGR